MSLTDFERARWYAYVRVFRDHENIKTPNPCDPDSLWLNSEYDAEAERVWVEEHTPPRRSELLVRDGFEKLRVRDWTLAEVDVMFRRREDQAEARGFGRGIEGVSRLLQANASVAQAEGAKLKAIVGAYALPVDTSPLPPATDKERRIRAADANYEMAKETPIKPGDGARLLAMLGGPASVEGG